MRVFHPYTALRDDVTGPLREQASDLELVDVTGSDEAYWAMLRDAWATGEDFAVVEHDVVIAPRTFVLFEECDRAWCSCADPYADPLHPENGFLQCVRFRGALTRELPDFIESMPAFTRSWMGLDMMIFPRLEARGYRQHNHPETPTFHDFGHTPEERTVRTMALLRWLAGYAPEARRALATWHRTAPTATELEKRDAEVFAVRASQASLLLGQGIENLSDDELRRRLQLGTPRPIPRG